MFHHGKCCAEKRPLFYPFSIKYSNNADRMSLRALCISGLHQFDVCVGGELSL